MGVGARRVVRGPDGRAWVVRSYRFRRPPWRSFDPDFGLFDDLEVVGIIAFPLALVGLVLQVFIGFFAVLVIPLGVFLVEAPIVAVASLYSTRRWIEAAHDGPPSSRMTWWTSADRAESVVDQVARRLELGYDRIEPHGAEFVGFG